MNIENIKNQLFKALKHNLISKDSIFSAGNTIVLYSNNKKYKITIEESDDVLEISEKKT